MTYAQRISLHLANLNVPGKLRIKNISLYWVQFYEGSKDNAIVSSNV